MHIYTLDSPRGLAYARFILKTQGIRGLVVKLKHALQLQISKIIAYLHPRSKHFKFQNRKLSYLNNPYNDTSFSERSVEIPIALNIVSQYKPHQILELGHVLSYYRKFTHTIVDKFEKDREIIQQDIIDYRPKTKFDLIISVSTIEHIGFDDDKMDPTKIAKTFTHCQKLLKPNGKIFFTAPIGYNPALDRLIFDSNSIFNKLNFLIRSSWNNQWQIATASQVRNLKYASYYNNAQAIVIGEIHN